MITSMITIFTVPVAASFRVMECKDVKTWVRGLETAWHHLEDLQLIGFVRSTDALLGLNRGHLYRLVEPDLEGEREAKAIHPPPRYN